MTGASDGCYVQTYLPLPGSGKPSRVHAICGVGFPAELHLRDTAGPGCSVCSIKLYNRTGGASETVTRRGRWIGWNKIKFKKKILCYQNSVAGGISSRTGQRSSQLHGNRILLDKLMVVQLAKKFPAIYGTRMLITVFSRANHCLIFWGRWWIHYTTLQCIYLSFNIIFPSTSMSSE